MSVSDDVMYSTAVQTWKFQVEQFWSRSSYHVVFQLALGAGIWKVFEDKYFRSSALLSVGAVIFAGIWILNTERTTEYISYHWQSLKKIEGLLEIPAERRIFSNAADWLDEKRTFPGDYKDYVRMVPPIFLFAWIWMFIFSLHNVR